MNSEKRLYQAIVWNEGQEQTGERTTVLADDLEDAERQLKKRYGERIIFSLYSEDEATKAR